MSPARTHRAITSACVVLLVGCATSTSGSGDGSQGPFQQLFASNDPCSNNARNIGIAGGVLVGLLIGNSAGKGKDESLAVGALVGGFLGGLIGADLDRKRCELARIAKQYDLNISFTAIDANGDVIAPNGAPNTGGIPGPRPTGSVTPIGSSLTVRDKDGLAGHFASGSDELSPKAKEYFGAIANQFTAAKMLEGQANANKRDEIAKQVAKRRIFLIGHTDDTGSTQLNAALSERRARSVAAFLKQQGIAEDALYFQGAGETMPIADNRSEAGREENRRVELLEIADEAAFTKYLEARRPNYQFYRPRFVGNVAAVNASKPNSVNASGSQPATASSSPAQVGVNFGGLPYSPAEATLNVGSIAPTKTFGLISKAYADDTVALTDCTRDRPRAVGSVKSFRSGMAYKTNEHLPQLYGKTWAADVNGNLVVVNHLSVLRDGGAPANLPELKVYAKYKPEVSKKPEVNEEPSVNTYVVSQGLLYRMFPRGDAGLRCVDVLFGIEGATTAKGGKIIYGSDALSYVANFKPQLQ